MKRDRVLINAEVEEEVNGGYLVSIWTVNGKRSFPIEREEIQFQFLRAVTPVDEHGPAIEHHPIAVIREMREEYEPNTEENFEPYIPD
jgi:hypothetical protein